MNFYSMTHERLTYLLNQFAGKRLVEEEKNELKQFLDSLPDHNLSEELVRPLLQEKPAGSSDYMTEASRQHVLQSIFALDKFLGRSNEIIEIPQPSAPVHPAHRIHFLRKWGWAAAAILVIGTTIAIALSHNKESGPIKKNIAVSQVDIPPGSNNAILTLSNGQRIELDSTASSTIKDGSLSIQNKNGGLIYGKGGAAVMNTMSTSNGGQYQLILADGTKVWLNAASSITYPTAFNSPSRQVRITGEAYLEVAKDNAHPFMVDVAGQSTVEVLGTSFNVNTYADEGEIRTTLVEGSIRIGNENGVILKPGQQAIQRADTGKVALSSDKIRIVTVDPDQIISWKNGLFSFNNTDLRSVLKQLERWYDIKVRYEGGASSVTLKGEMYRNVNLSDVLEYLKDMGLKFRMEGKTLVVLPISETKH